RLVELLRAVGDCHGRTPGEGAIAWTMRHPAVTGAIVGLRRAGQPAGGIGAAQVRLSPAQGAEIEGVHKERAAGGGPAMGDTGQGIWEAVRADFADLPDAGLATQLGLRLLLAALLGGLLGYERERTGKAAGMRTHMLVAVGAALFVLVPQQAGASSADL